MSNSISCNNDGSILTLFQFPTAVTGWTGGTLSRTIVAVDTDSYDIQYFRADENFNNLSSTMPYNILIVNNTLYIMYRGLTSSPVIVFTTGIAPLRVKLFELKQGDILYSNRILYGITDDIYPAYTENIITRDTTIFGLLAPSNNISGWEIINNNENE
jgi:hypothetical protein